MASCYGDDTEEYKRFVVNQGQVGLGGLGVPCSLRDPRFAGSYTAEVD